MAKQITKEVLKRDLRLMLPAALEKGPGFTIKGVSGHAYNVGLSEDAAGLMFTCLDADAKIFVPVKEEFMKEMRKRAENAGKCAKIE